MLDYTAPSTVEEAVRALAGASGVAKVLSGGTDLLVQLRSGRAKPDLIVDIKNIPDMSGVRERDGAFVIGAATPGAVIGECEALRQAWPGVVEAANLIGSTQIQGRASLAGNLCNASPAADSVPALIAARATCVVAGPNGRREVPVESIVTGPGRTSLGPGEFIVAFHLPKPPPRSADAYLRFIPRTEMDIAVVGAGGQCHARSRRHLHRRSGRAGCRGADGAPGCGCRRVGRAQARRDGAGRARPGGAARLQADRRQARNDRIPDQGRRRVGTPDGDDRLRARKTAWMRERR